jgi:uncharacterized protein (DUF1697 family)
VGGKNTIPMLALRKCLEELGFTGVTTYIASGNVLVQTAKSPEQIKDLVESA